MNLDKMQKIAAYLERISADDKQKIVDDMAKNAPYLFAGNIDMSDKDKATTLIKMQINILSDADFGMESITTFEGSYGFIQGLIVGCAMGGLLTEQEEDTFKKKAIAARDAFYKNP